VTDRLPASADGIARAVEVLGRGGIVAFPTDTVYGLAVGWDRVDRLDAMYAMKRRPAEKQIAALISGLEQATTGGWVADARAMRLTERFWPGPLTLVLSGSTGPAGETQGFRVPDHPVALDLIRAAGPLLATSANVSGEPDTLDADDVLIAFATQQSELDVVIDGGRVPGGIASTVVDLTVTPARILRDGPITRDDLAAVLELARGPLGPIS
jgi:L-threonylcarbamoyladenylate synthase